MLLFDLDGTLTDSRRLVVDASVEALRRGAGVIVSPRAIAGTLPLTVTDRFRRFAPARRDEVADLYLRLYASRVAEAAPFPGIPEMLAALRGRGVRCGVVTARRRDSAALTLRVHRLTRYFEVVVGEEDAVASKPAAAPVLAAVSALGARADEAVMIGDSLLDLRSGRAAGAAVGAALWGKAPHAALRAFGPEYVFGRPREVAFLVPPS